MRVLQCGKLLVNHILPLGNLYNYFTNKEELLGVVLSPSIKSLNKLVEVHLNEEIKVHSLEEVDEALKQFGNFFDESDFRYLWMKE